MIEKKLFGNLLDTSHFRKKRVGLNLHVSNFLTKVNGRLKTEENEAYVIIKPGTNCNGW
jgi:hypothetical protein